MSPQVKPGKDFDEAHSTKRNPAPHYEPQHLPPPPPAPRLSLPALGYTAFYSSIPTVADSIYTAIVPTTNPTSSSPTTTTTSTTTPALTPTATNSNNPYLYYPHSTSFTASAEYQYHTSLGSKTPMQVVAMSNRKLNSDIYSTRSLSIHRRILVKNLLTLLYEMNPMLDWFDGSSGYDVGMYEDDEGDVSNSSEPLLAEEEQNGWIEQTLSAAGLSDDDDEEIVKKMKQGRSDKAKTTTKSNLTKSAVGRGSVGGSISNNDNDNNNNNKKNTAAPGSGVDQSTPSIKTGQNASSSITIPPPPPTRPTQNSSSSSSSIISVLPSFPPAPTNRAYSLPALPAAPSSSAPPARVPQSPPRMTYTLSPPSSSSSASSTTSSSSSGSYTGSSSGSALSLSNKAPSPRPKSVELPQSLNNYLSVVFDVDWSVELPTMEDSLYTFKGSSLSALTSSSGTLSHPGTSSYLNGSLLSSAPKRRSLSSSASTMSTSSFSTLSKHSTTSSSSSLSSVDSWNKSPPIAATETTTTTTTTTPHGTVTSGEIMIAKSVQQLYHGSSHASLVARGENSGTNTTGSTKSLPPSRQQDTQRVAAGTGPAPIKGGAVPRAGDGQNALKFNAAAKNNIINNNNGSNNRQLAINMSVSSPRQTTRKTTLVPGRRSSLQHTGQMPPASGSRKSPTSGPTVVAGSNLTPTTVTITKITTTSVGSAIPTNNSTNPTLPPPANASFANGYHSFGSSNNGTGRGVNGGRQQAGFGPGQGSGSGSGGPGSPSIARRTSSLQPMERLAIGHRNPSSEYLASSVGLPRPLLAKSFSSPIVVGAVGGGAAANLTSPASPPSPLPVAALSSGTTTASGNEYYGSHHNPHQHRQSNRFSAGGFPVVNSRGHPQAPRKLAVMPPVSPPTGPSNTSNFMPITPPRSPSRGATTASISSYVLTPAPAVSSLSSYGSSASGAPILPPLFPIQNEDRKSSGSPTTSPYSRRSPTPSSPSSTNEPLNYQYHHRQQQQQQQQKQHLSPPNVYTRGNSDEQIHSRSTPFNSSAPTRFSPSPSPPPSSTSPSPTGSSSSSTATSLSQGSQPSLVTITTTSTTARSATSFGMKASKSSPDLTTGLSSDWYFVNAPGQMSAESLAQRPLPSLPPQYQPYVQQQKRSYTYQPLSHQHPQRQQSYSYGEGGGGADKSSRGGGGYKSGMTSAPLPLSRIMMSPSIAGPNSSQISGSGGSNRWATMKTMFSLKTTTGHGGK
ncbi:hypothetical protein BGZ47_005668 [Haplosporangium gracile]|nr:hypothetical protein BGZ47_005668 [Haplosporangium gracile]